MSSRPLSRTTTGRISSHLPAVVDGVNRENVLGDLDAHGQNRPRFTLPNELMRDCTSHRGIWLPFTTARGSTFHS